MYSFRKEEENGVESIEIIDDSTGDSIGSVSSEGDADVLLGYLNAGQGGFTISPLMDEGRREYAFVSGDDVWVAYTTSETASESILTHLNRNG